MLPHGPALFPHGPAMFPHSPVLPWSLAAALTHLYDQPPPPTQLPLLPATCCVSTSPCGHSSAAQPGCENCHNERFSQPNCSTDELAPFSVGQQSCGQQLPPDPVHAAHSDLHPKPRRAATTPAKPDSQPRQLQGGQGMTAGFTHRTSQPCKPFPNLDLGLGESGSI